MDPPQQQQEFCANCSSPFMQINETGSRCGQLEEEEEQQIFLEIYIQTGYLSHDEHNLDMTVFNSHHHHQQPKTTVKVNQVLSSIYKLDYLYQFMDQKNEQENIAVCRRCADKLAQLYKIYNDFNELRRLDSYLANKLTHLDRLVQSHSHCHQQHNNNNHNTATIKEDYGVSYEEDSAIVDADYGDDYGDCHTMNENTFDSTLEFDLVCQNHISNNSIDPIKGANVKIESQQPQRISKGPPWVHLVGLTSKEIINAGATWPPQSNNDLVTTTTRSRRQKSVKNKKSRTRCAPQFFEDDPPSSDVTDDDGNDSDFDPVKSTKKELSMDSDTDHDPWTATSEKLPKTKSRSRGQSQDKLKQNKVTQRQQKEADKDARLYQCPHCDKSYKTSDSLQQHSFAHAADGAPYKCPLCSKGFRTTFRRNKHLSERHEGEPSPEKGHKCTHDPCEEAFYCIAELDRHVLKRHSADDTVRPFVCPQCPRRFMYDGSLQDHVSSIHLGIGFPCTTCGKSLKDQKTLARHVLLMHPPSHIFLCSHCGQNFRTSVILKRHVAVTHTNEKPHKCNDCDYAAYSKIDLERHVANRHTNERLYQCAHCQKSFAVEAILKQHEMLHNAPFSLLCTACGKCFQTRSLLNRHFYRLHADEKRHQCSVCDMTFKTRPEKSRHELIHFEKTKICSHCGKAFAQVGGLQRHLLTHTGQKPYKCKLCPVAFSDNRPLKKHMLSHHPNAEASQDK